MELPSVGIAGEVRCVITGVDGKVNTDTGYQKNLILNQGLDFFGGGKGSSFNASCAIGSGNSAPAITQTQLDAFIAMSSGTDTTSNYGYVDTGDGLYRMWEQKKYRFTGLGDINIGELGLVSQGSNAANHYLTTRVLPKDSMGVPTSLSLKLGETLDIYYKLHKVIDTRDQSFVINVLDGNGGSVSYNAVIRPMFVGDNTKNVVGYSLDTETSYVTISTSDLSAITASPAIAESFYKNSVSDAYVASKYKKITKVSLSLGEANQAIRVITLGTGNVLFSFMPFQMRLGRVSDDAPLTKTNKDTLSIPLEFSWGRYEGVL